MNNNIDSYAALHVLQHHARAGEPCKICGQPIRDPKNSYWIDTKKDWVCKSCIENKIETMQREIKSMKEQLENCKK